MSEMSKKLQECLNLYNSLSEKEIQEFYKKISANGEYCETNTLGMYIDELINEDNEDNENY